MTAGERLFQAAVWHLEDPSEESRQALAEAASAFEAWRVEWRQGGRDRLVNQLLLAQGETARVLRNLLNGDADEVAR